MIPLNIFVVDDEDIVRVSLSDDLRDAGYRVKEFAKPALAFDAIEKNRVDVVITDIKMPKMGGIELLKKIKAIKPDVTVIVMTAFGSVESAVEAMKMGAYDYITKPFKVEEILLRLERIREMRSIQKQNIQYRSQLEKQYNINSLIGKSKSTENIRELVTIAAKTPAIILITGETGTGKELVTNIIHYISPRKDKPLVKVSCATLSPQIFESELFGHEKGAFTGADKERIGRFELADGGTIYLDDVDDIPLDLQVKLLRILENQEFERVGGNETLKIDVKVIASTKADLKKLANEGKFREDLLFRLNVFPIHIQPVRERKEDIPLLIDHFLNDLSLETKISIDAGAIQYLTNYPWPGNVRELKNLLERLVLLSQNNHINVSLLPLEIICPVALIPETCLGKKPLDEMLSEIEINVIRKTLLTTNGNQARAAELLGIPASTLRTKMSKYGLS